MLFHALILLLIKFSDGANPLYWGIYNRFIADGIFNASLVTILDSGEVVENSQIFSNSTSNAAYLVAERDQKGSTVAIWTMHYNCQFLRYDLKTKNATILPFGDLQGQIYGIAWWNDRKSTKKGLLVLACCSETWHLWFVSGDATTPPEILVSLRPFDKGFAWCDPGGASLSLLPERNEAYIFLTLTAFLIVDLDTKRLKFGPDWGRWEFSCDPSIKAVAARGNSSEIAYVGAYAFQTSVGTIDITRKENYCTEKWDADSKTDIVCVDPLYPWILSNSTDIILLCQPILSIFHFDQEFNLSRLKILPKDSYSTGNWAGLDFYSPPG